MALGAAAGAGITIGGAGITTTNAGALTVTEATTLNGTLTANGLATFNTDVDFTLLETENIAVTNTVTGINAVDLASLTLTNNTTSGTQRGITVFTAGTGTTEAGITIEATAGALTDALRISESGTGAITNGITLASAFTVGINAGNNTIENIGAAGTDFTTTGGLTLADTLSVSAGGATVTAGGLTITAGALAVNSDSITSDGVLVIDATSAVVLGTATNGFRVDETFGAGSGWLGTAQPTKRIYLSAEFAGASLTGDGTGNTGTMTSDNEAVAPFRNYYNWTSTTVGNDHDIWIKVLLPDDWASWSGIGTGTGFGTAATEDVVVQVYGTNDVSVCSSDIVTAVGWNTDVALCDYTAGTFTAGQDFLVRVTLRVNTASNNARISYIVLPYKAKF